MPVLSRADVDRAAAWEVLLMLGAESVISAARGWSDFVEIMELFVRRQKHDIDARLTASALSVSGQARQAFYREVRHDLGIRATS